MRWGNCVQASFPPLWPGLSAVQAQAYFLPRLASTLTVWTPTVCQGGYGLPALGGHPSPSLVWVKPGITDVIGVTALQPPSDAGGWVQGPHCPLEPPPGPRRGSAFHPSQGTNGCTPNLAALALRLVWVTRSLRGPCCERAPTCFAPAQASCPSLMAIRPSWPSVSLRLGCGCVAL